MSPAEVDHYTRSLTRGELDLRAVLDQVHLTASLLFTCIVAGWTGCVGSYEELV